MQAWLTLFLKICLALNSYKKSRQFDGIFSYHILLCFFHLKHKSDRSGTLAVSCRNGQSQAVLSLGEGNFFSAVQHMDLGDLSGVGNEDSGLHGFLSYRIETDRIDLVTLLSEGQVSALVRSTDSGSVDGLAVGLHPLTETKEALSGVNRDTAVGLRAYVEGHISALGNDVYKEVDQLTGSFVAVAVLVGEISAQSQAALPGHE